MTAQPLSSSVPPPAGGLAVLPAIDLRGGHCVRLYQGDYGQETVYGDDPVAQAIGFQSQGAAMLHVVDLDAALTGEPVNRSVIADVCAALSIPVQVGGGVRGRDAAEALFDIGVARVVVGTAALERPELVAELVSSGRRVAVGIDARGDEVATHGWTERTGRRTNEVAQQFADLGVEALVVTEIGRDGTMTGPDLDGLAAILQALGPVGRGGDASVGSVATGVIASGGVGRLADLEALAGLDAGGRRLAGAIVGRALYEGVFTLAGAVAVAVASADGPKGSAVTSRGERS